MGRDVIEYHDDDREKRPEPAVRKAPAEQRSAPDLTNDPIPTTLWRFTTPLAFGFIVSAIYSWTDMYFVSRLGDTATAALGMGDQIGFVIFTLGSGFCVGTGIVVARRIGENRRREAELVATQAFSFMAIYATVAALLVYAALPYVYDLLGLTGELRAMTSIYTSTTLFGFVGNMLVFQANASIRSTGNTLFPMVVLVISAVANACIDPILIYGMFGMPALGIQGAAISTSIAQWIGAIICAYALYTGRLNIRLYRPTLRFDRKLIVNIFRIGLPASLQGMAVSLSRVAIISIANVFGTAAVAALTIGSRIDVLVFMPIFAVGIAVETLTSQNIGARRYDRVKGFQRVANIHTSLLVGSMSLALLLLADTVIGVFTSDRAVVELTSTYLQIAVAGYLLFIFGQTGTRMLSGAGHSLRSMTLVVAVLFLVQIPLAYLLSHHTPLGVAGVFAGVTASYLVFALASTLAVRGERWMLKQV